MPIRGVPEQQPADQVPLLLDSRRDDFGAQVVPQSPAPSSSGIFRPAVEPTVQPQYGSAVFQPTVQPQYGSAVFQPTVQPAYQPQFGAAVQPVGQSQQYEYVSQPAAQQPAGHPVMQPTVLPPPQYGTVEQPAQVVTKSTVTTTKLHSVLACQRIGLILKLMSLVIAFIFLWIAVGSRRWAYSLPSNIVYAPAIEIGNVNIPKNHEVMVAQGSSHTPHLFFYAGLWDICFSQIAHKGWLWQRLSKVEMGPVIGTCTAHANFPENPAKRLFGSSGLIYIGGVFLIIAFIIGAVDLVLTICLMKCKERRTKYYFVTVIILSGSSLAFCLVAIICAAHYFTPGESAWRVFGLMLQWGTALYFAIFACIFLFISFLFSLLYYMFEQARIKKTIQAEAQAIAQQNATHQLLDQKFRQQEDRTRELLEDRLHAIGGAAAQAAKEGVVEGAAISAQQNEPAVMVHSYSAKNLAANDLNASQVLYAQPMRGASGNSDGGGSRISYESERWNNGPVYAHPTTSQQQYRPQVVEKRTVTRQYSSPINNNADDPVNQSVNFTQQPMSSNRLQTLPQEPQHEEIEEIMTFKVPENYDVSQMLTGGNSERAEVISDVALSRPLVVAPQTPEAPTNVSWSGNSPNQSYSAMTSPMGRPPPSPTGSAAGVPVPRARPKGSNQSTRSSNYGAGASRGLNFSVKDLSELDRS